VVVLEHSSETGPRRDSCVALVDEGIQSWDAIPQTLMVTQVQCALLPWDGRAGYAISCSHFYQNWSSCGTKAGRLCRTKGHTVSYSDEVNAQMIVGYKVAGSDSK
jgi:hypothetical protein